MYDKWAERVKYPEGNYPEDYKYENGNYMNKCIKCGNDFMGYKRKIYCKSCINKETKETECDK